MHLCWPIADLPQWQAPPAVVQKQSGAGTSRSAGAPYGETGCKRQGRPEGRGRHKLAFCEGRACARSLVKPLKSHGLAALGVNLRMMWCARHSCSSGRMRPCPQHGRTATSPGPPARECSQCSQCRACAWAGAREGRRGTAGEWRRVDRPSSRIRHKWGAVGQDNLSLFCAGADGHGALAEARGGDDDEQQDSGFTAASRDEARTR